MRYVVARKENNKINENSNLQSQLLYEKKNIDNIDGCLSFKKIVKNLNLVLLKKFHNLKKAGKLYVDTEQHQKAQQY